MRRNPTHAGRRAQAAASPPPSCRPPAPRPPPPPAAGARSHPTGTWCRLPGPLAQDSRPARPLPLPVSGSKRCLCDPVYIFESVSLAKTVPSVSARAGPRAAPVPDGRVHLLGRERWWECRGKAGGTRWQVFDSLARVRRGAGEAGLRVQTAVSFAAAGRFLQGWKLQGEMRFTGGRGLRG